VCALAATTPKKRILGQPCACVDCTRAPRHIQRLQAAARARRCGAQHRVVHAAGHAARAVRHVKPRPQAWLQHRGAPSAAHARAARAHVGGQQREYVVRERRRQRKERTVALGSARQACAPSRRHVATARTTPRQLTRRHAGRRVERGASDESDDDALSWRARALNTQPANPAPHVPSGAPQACVSADLRA
jgi:hypothetical protein